MNGSITKFSERVKLFYNSVAYREKVVSDSYYHSSGFLKLAFRHPEIDVHDVRLHIWKTGSQDCDLHSHSSNLISTVLLGQIEEDRWVEHTMGKEYIRYCYSSKSLGGTGQFTKPKSVDLVHIGAHTLSAGDVYRIERKTIHTVANRQAVEAITLVEKPVKSENFSFVYDPRRRIATAPEAPVQDAEVERYIALAAGAIIH